MAGSAHANPASAAFMGEHRDWRGGSQSCFCYDLCASNTNPIRPQAGIIGYTEALGNSNTSTRKFGSIQRSFPLWRKRWSS